VTFLAMAFPVRRKEEESWSTLSAVEAERLFLVVAFLVVAFLAEGIPVKEILVVAWDEEGNLDQEEEPLTGPAEEEILEEVSDLAWEVSWACQEGALHQIEEEEDPVANQMQVEEKPNNICIYIFF
jgi:hypothetical protein